MKKYLFILFIFILSSCGGAAFGTRSHYAADTAIGKVGWDVRYGYLYNSGKPDVITYSEKDIEVKITTSELENKPYTIGLCVLIPLPIIPMFGLVHDVYNGPFSIKLTIYRADSSYQLVKANILVNDKIIPPTNIEYEHLHVVYNEHYGKKTSYLGQRDNQKYNNIVIHTRELLPLTLDKGQCVLTYDTNGILLDSFDLMLTVQDSSGALYIEDKIIFKREKSSYLQCIL